MLPTASAVIVGRLLAERFGLPLWQVATTASDANRAAIRWARAVTQRPVILVFDGCYHGMVEDAFVVLKDGAPVMKPGLLGQVHDHTRHHPRRAFQRSRGAGPSPGAGRHPPAILAEPAVTNCGNDPAAAELPGGNARPRRARPRPC